MKLCILSLVLINSFTIITATVFECISVIRAKYTRKIYFRRKICGDLRPRT